MPHKKKKKKTETNGWIKPWVQRICFPLFDAEVALCKE